MPERFERCLKHALCVTTGQNQAIPVKALRLESGVFSMTNLLYRQITIAYEKAARSPQSPTSQLSRGLSTIRPSWSCPTHQLQGNPFQIKLRALGPARVPGEHTEGAVPHHFITGNISLQSVGETTSDVTMYADGPATGGTTAKGAVMIATVRYPADPIIIHTSKIRGVELSCSYEEEKSALPLALDWVWDN